MELPESSRGAAEAGRLVRHLSFGARRHVLGRVQGLLDGRFGVGAGATPSEESSSSSATSAGRGLVSMGCAGPPAGQVGNAGAHRNLEARCSGRRPFGTSCVADPFRCVVVVRAAAQVCL